MPSITPTPLPIIHSSEVEDPQKLQESFDNLLIYLKRTNRVLFDSSVEDSLGQQLTGLGDRPKDIYTFPIGTPTITPEDPGYAVTPLDVQADGTVVECNMRGQKGATAPIVVQIQLDGRVIATLQASTADIRVIESVEVPVTKTQQLRVVVIEAPSDPGFDDAVVHVLVR